MQSFQAGVFDAHYHTRETGTYAKKDDSNLDSSSSGLRGY